MTTRRLAVCMTILNVALLAALAAERGGAAAPEPAPVLRGSALELVDAQGQIRARLGVEEGGEVVLRLRRRAPRRAPPAARRSGASCTGRVVGWSSLPPGGRVPRVGDGASPRSRIS